MTGCVLGLLLATDVHAAGLVVQTGQSRSPQSGHADAFSIRITNEGRSLLSELRVFGPSDIQISCDGFTSAGRSFQLGGVLLAGDTAACTGHSPAPISRRRSMGLAVSAREPDGRAQVQHVGVTNSGAIVTPAQGAIVLLGAGIHNDGNNDGRLNSGETINYHYTVLNLGSIALSAITVTDLSGGVICPQSSLAVNATMICTRQYTVTATDATAGFILNDIRTVGTDALALPVQGGDVVATLNLAGTAGIRVFKSPLLLNDADSSGFASVGDLLRYTFIVKNGNAQLLNNVELIEPDPTRIDTPIVCMANALSGLPFAGNGTGVLQSTDLVLCSADYTVRTSDQNLGQALNLVEARANAPVAGAIAATGASAVVVPGGFLLTVTKTVNLSSVFPGGTVIYTVVVSNPGTLPVANVTISDPLPPGIETFSWTCAGPSCPNPSGTGPILQTIPSFPAGAQVVYTVTATISANPPSSVVNVVTITPPFGVLCIPSNLPPPCPATVPIEIVPRPNPVPVSSIWTILVLPLTLSATAMVRIRRA